MLGELVGPENPILVTLVDPVLLHVRQQVKLAVGLKPIVNGLALVSGNDGAILGLVGRGIGVVLAAEMC